MEPKDSEGQQQKKGKQEKKTFKNIAAEYSYGLNHFFKKKNMKKLFLQFIEMSRIKIKSNKNELNRMDKNEWNKNKKKICSTHFSIIW